MTDTTRNTPTSPGNNTSLPRGIRNRNPGNIRRNAIRWQGMSEQQTDSAFVQFTSAVYGFRAMLKIFRSYQARGLTTLREMINTYAPAHENDSDAYTRFVAKRIGVNPDVELDLNRYALPLLRAVAEFENGTRPASIYSDSTIQQGINLA